MVMHTTVEDCICFPPRVFDAGDTGNIDACFIHQEPARFDNGFRVGEPMERSQLTK